MKRFVVSLVACALMLASPDRLGACSVFFEYPEVFDPYAYVLVGDVVGIAGPLKASDVSTTAIASHDAWGIRVRIRDRVCGPRTLPDTVEIYRFDIDAVCNWSGSSRALVAEEYPIGARVRVVAQDMLPAESPPQTQPRTLIAPMRFYDVSVDDLEGWPASSTSVLEYGTLGGAYLDALRALRDREPDGEERLYRFEAALYFEWYKELVRLHEARSQTEVDDVMRRLARYPNVFIRYDKLLATYVPDPRLAVELCKTRQAWEDEVTKLRPYGPPGAAQVDACKEPYTPADSLLKSLDEPFRYVRLPKVSVVTRSEPRTWPSPETDGVRLLRAIQEKLSLQGRITVDADANRLVVVDWEPVIDAVAPLVDRAEDEAEAAAGGT